MHKHAMQGHDTQVQPQEGSQHSSCAGGLAVQLQVQCTSAYQLIHRAQSYSTSAGDMINHM
jgi:hypothetical protein